MFGVWHRHFRRTDPAHRGIQMPEPLLHDPRRNLGRQRAGAPAFIHHHRPAAALQRGQNGGIIQGAQHAQIDHFDLDAVGGQHLGGLQRLPQRAAIGDQRQIAPRPADGGAVDVHRSGVGRQLAGAVIEHHMLEDQHRVWFL